MEIRSRSFKVDLVFVFSGNDGLLPSGDEARRLKSTLKNCTVRHFKDNGHTILLVSGFSFRDLPSLSTSKF